MRDTKIFAPIIEKCYRDRIDLLSDKLFIVIPYKWFYNEQSGHTPLFIHLRKKTFFDPGFKSEPEMIELRHLLVETKVYYRERNVLFVMTWYHNPTGFRNGMPKNKAAYDLILINRKRFVGEIKTRDFNDASIVRNKFTSLFNEGLRFFS